MAAIEFGAKGRPANVTYAARLAFNLARASAGNNIAAKIAIMAITTNSSIKVKAHRREG